DALVQFGQSIEAWPLLEEVLRRTPDDPTVLLVAARCLRAIGQPQLALAYLDTLLRDHPDDAEGWAERGGAWKDQGNSSEALLCLRRAFELDPRSSRLCYLLLTELLAQQMADEAE